MDFSWSTQFKLKSRAPTRDQRNWALDEYQVFPITDEQLLVRGKFRNGKAIIAANIFHALSTCTSFQHNDIQLKKILACSPWLADRQSEVQKVIDSLIQNGLIVTADILLAEFRSATKSQREIRKKTTTTPTYITTCDRPKALERLLESIAIECSDHSERWQITIVDDSRDESSVTANHNIIQRVQSVQPQLNLQHHDHKSRQALSDRIGKRRPALSDALSFLTAGEPKSRLPTYGAARNRALLLAEQSRLIMVDDDVVLKKHQYPTNHNSVKVGTNRRYVHFFSPNQSQSDFCQATTTGVLTSLAQHLGLTLTQSLQRNSRNQITTESFNGETMRSLHDISTDSEVILTTCGVMGDPGTATNRWLLNLSHEETQNLTANESVYRQRLTRRNLISGQLENTYCTEFTLISTVMGVDNEKLIPPYFPVFRNEDFLFGRMIKFLHPNSLIFDQPWFVPHLPIIERYWDEKEIYRPEQMGILYFLGVYIEKLRTAYISSSVQTRYDALVSIFSDLANADNKSILGIVRTEMTTLAIAIIQESDRSLTEFKDLPDYWKQDVARRRDANIHYLQSIDTYFLSDLAYAGTMENQLALFRLLVGKYAHSLKQWCEIKQAITSESVS